MEKIGLFDLIDKFNSMANDKHTFQKPQPTQTANSSAIPPSNGFYDPEILPPKQYLMNAKLQNFCKTHEEFSNSVKNKNS